MKDKDSEKIYHELLWPSFVMKTSINIYLIEFSDFNKNVYPPRTIQTFYLFDMEDYILLDKYYGWRNNDSYIKKYLHFYNNFSSGEFINDIKFKNKIIPKGTIFIIGDIEILALRNKEKEEKFKTYAPIK